MVRQVVRGVGKTLISAGVLILLFVVYQLWGTGLHHDRAQKRLRSEFARQLAAPAAADPAPASSAPTTAAPTTVAAPLVEGEAAAVIGIPKIGLDQVVVEGVGVEDLKKGVGHYPDTKMPGEKGNSALAGHRTTYGAPFNKLDELVAGDAINVTTRAGTFRYDVTEKKVVTPDTVSVLDDTPDNRLTLTTCHPKYSAEQRLIVIGHLVGPPIGEQAEPVPATETTTPPRSRELAAGVNRPGLSGAGAENRPAIAWAILAATVWLAAWAIGRWTGRKWTAYLVGAPVFFVVLFMFFENVARLLPANV
ncbi:MAG: class E sortase [Actinomycetota bacterium]|nr:class E sortase [Actinomycetota bacterium]